MVSALTSFAQTICWRQAIDSTVSTSASVVLLSLMAIPMFNVFILGSGKFSQRYYSVVSLAHINIVINKESRRISGFAETQPLDAIEDF